MVSLQPKSTHWFETYVPREQTVYALEALVASGQVELEKDYAGRPLLDTGSLRAAVREARSLVERHGALLPPPGSRKHVISSHPERAAQAVVGTLRRCLAAQLRRLRRDRAIGLELHRLRLLQRYLHASEGDAEDPREFSGQGRFLCRAVFACPKDRPGAPPAPAIPARRFADDAYAYYAVVCLPDERPVHAAAFRDGGCEMVEVPAWLAAEWPLRHRRIQQQIRRLQVERRGLAEAVDRSREDPQLAEALSDLAVLEWYLERSVTLSGDHHHCHVTGWTTAADPVVLQAALEQASIDAKILFRPVPPGHLPPVALDDGLLLGPFRQFVRLFGVPGDKEIDPTPMVSVLVPVLFGFMFPDVGHGLVLAAASLLLWRRYPRLRFLVPCGLTAAGFGVLFGETFGHHTPSAALLVCPMEQPLVVLLASMALGVVILLLGLALSGVEAAWRGALRQWLWLDAAVLVLYLSGLVAVLHPSALAVAALALGWYLVGLAVTRQAAAAGLGRLLLSVFELGLNTLSFARVGAFAIAHAALTHVLLELAGQIDPPLLQWLLLIVGHGLIILVEGLVVSVQTTRLVLFEFFTRFLRADGRLFRPLAPATRAVA